MRGKVFKIKMLSALVFMLFMNHAWAQIRTAGLRQANKSNLQQVQFLQNSGGTRDDSLMHNHDSVSALLKYTEKCVRAGLINLELFINPSTNQLLLRFKSEQTAYTSFKWYDDKDSLIYRIRHVSPNRQQFIQLILPAKELNLHKGKYTVLIRNNEAVYMKRIVFY